MASLWDDAQDVFRRRRRRVMGTVVVNEIVLPIVGLRLIEGGIEIRTSRDGPFPGWAGGMTEVRVYDAEGHRVVEARLDTPAWPGARDGWTVLNHTVPITLIGDSV